MVAACSIVCLVYGAVVMSAPAFFTRLVAGESFEPDALALIGWLTVALVVGVSTPVGSLALVLRTSWIVFVARLLGSLIAIALTAGVLLIDQPSAVPMALAAGARPAAFCCGGWSEPRAKDRVDVIRLNGLFYVHHMCPPP